MFAYPRLSGAASLRGDREFALGRLYPLDVVKPVRLNSMLSRYLLVDDPLDLGGNPVH